MARPNSVAATERAAHPLANLATRIALGHKQAATALTWTCTGAQVAVGGDESTIRVFDAERLAIRDLSQEKDSKLFNGHKGSIEQLVASPINPNLFASAGQDMLVNLYDMRAGPGPVKHAQTERGNINMDWSPDGTWLIVGDREDNIYIIDANDMMIKRTIDRKMEVNQMRWNCDGTLIYLACGDGTVEVASWPTMRHLHTLRGHRDRCYAVACDPTGQRIAVSSKDTCVTVWNSATLNCLFAIDRAETVVRVADYSHDGRYLASASVTGGIELSAAESGARVHRIPTSLSVTAMKWHPRALLLAYCVDEDIRRPVAPVARMYPNAPQPVLPQSRAYIYGYPLPKSVMHRSGR